MAGKPMTDTATINERMKLMAVSKIETASKIKRYGGSGGVKAAHTRQVIKYLYHTTTGITQADAIREFGDYRLSATINILREDGFAIITELERNTHNQGHHARYFLIYNDQKPIGEMQEEMAL